MVLENPYACLNTKWKAKSRRWTTSSNLNNVNFMLCNAHNVEDKKFTLTEEIFFVMNFLVTSLKKAMLSRIFFVNEVHFPHCGVQNPEIKCRRREWVAGCCLFQKKWMRSYFLLVCWTTCEKFTLKWNAAVTAAAAKKLRGIAQIKKFFHFLKLLFHD